MINKLKQYEKAVQKAKEIKDKAESIRKELAKNCTHPKSYIKPSSYEHDDGYGSQKQVIGKQCFICFAENYYGYWTKRNL